MKANSSGTRRPTILQVIPALETGGAELSTLEIADAITRAGGRALVASEGGRLEPRLKELGGEAIRISATTKNPLALANNARLLAGIVGAENVALVHARSRAPAWSSLWAARMTSRPFVTTYHGAYNEKSRAKNYYNGVMARGDLVIANSQYTANLIVSRYGTDRARIRTIYRGVPYDRFDPAAVGTERIAKLRERWGVAPGKRIVLHAARLTRWKGQLDVLGAAGELAKDFPDLVFVFAGDAQGRESYVAELRARAGQLGVQDAVGFVGHCDDMPAAYGAAHVTVVASNEPEAFGRAAAEAQAMGCPVISTNIGAPPETVLIAANVGRGNETGWLVPPHDPGAIAVALREAISLTEAERAALGQRARRHVIASFATSQMQRQTLEVYDRLLGTNLAEAFAASEAAAQRSL